jgi:hypothetical protein
MGGLQIDFGNLKGIDVFNRRLNSIKAPTADADWSAIFKNLTDCITDTPLERYPVAGFIMRFLFIPFAHVSS